MSKKLLDQFKNIPLMNIPPVSMDPHNELIKIYSGDFSLNGNGQPHNLKGSIEFRWFPDMWVNIHSNF